MSEIQAGDVVRLKSGGPNMTVERVDFFGTKELQARCWWFTGDGPKAHLFPPVVLEKVEQPGYATTVTG